MHAAVRRVASSKAVNRPAAHVIRRLLRGRPLADLRANPIYARAVRFPITDEFFAVDVGAGAPVELHAASLPFLYWSGIQTFEPEAMPVFRELVRDAGTVVDVGANVGVFSLVAARVNPRARIVAVEPNPQVAAILRETVERNAAPVTVIEAAISDVRGELELAVDGGLSSIVPARVAAARERARVTVETFDSLFPERVDVVKIDVEGAEVSVLRGMSRTLREHRPHVICEVAAGQLRAVADAVAPAGYRVLSLPDRTAATDAGHDVNVLLAPS